MSTAASPSAAGNIDFTVPSELRELLDRVRAYVEEDVLPAEAEAEDTARLLERAVRGQSTRSACGDLT